VGVIATNQRMPIMIKLIRSERVTPTESHFEIDVNGKIIQFAKWVDDDFCTDYEWLTGGDDLTDDEYEEVLDFINDQNI
jgi:hypothetical protein